MAHTLYIVQDLMAGLTCAEKSVADLVAGTSFDQALCRSLRENPKSQPIRYRSKQKLEGFVGVNCVPRLSIVEIKGSRFSLI